MLAPPLLLKPLTDCISKSKGHLWFLHATIEYYMPQATVLSKNDE
jgi:hypothetical protein